jgi:hypothetical protein
VTFRTNAANKNAYTLTSSEIALDYDGDGDLDCFKYYSFYNNYFERLPTTLAETPEGYDVNKYGSNKVIIIRLKSNLMRRQTAPAHCH